MSDEGKGAPAQDSEPESKHHLGELPLHLWNSLVFKAILAFDLEVRANPQKYLNEQYVEKLIIKERERTAELSGVARTLCIATLIALLYLANFSINIPEINLNYLEIPIIGEIMCLLIGVLLFGCVLIGLDIIILSRLRNHIAGKVGTDIPSIYFAHMKGDGLWADLFIEKVHGYKSTAWHRIASGIIFFFMVLFIFSLALIPYSVLVATFLKVISIKPISWSISSILQLSGLLFGTVSLISIVFATMVKFPFSREVFDRDPAAGSDSGNQSGPK